MNEQPAHASTGSVSVTVTRTFAAPAERVFDAFLDPQCAGRFLFATDEGQMVRAEIDARVGGRYTLTDRRNGQDIEHTGEYRAIDRPRRLAFTLVVSQSPPSLVAITLEPRGENCALTLTHEFPAAMSAYRERTIHGWTVVLGNLARVIGA